MNKKQIKLLDLIHRVAQEAYWSTRNDCGSDVTADCEPCHYYQGCLRAKEISQLLAELNLGEVE